MTMMMRKKMTLMLLLLLLDDDDDAEVLLMMMTLKEEGGKDSCSRLRVEEDDQAITDLRFALKRRSLSRHERKAIEKDFARRPPGVSDHNLHSSSAQRFCASVRESARHARSADHIGRKEPVARGKRLRGVAEVEVEEVDGEVFVFGGGRDELESTRVDVGRHDGFCAGKRGKR